MPSASITSGGRRMADALLHITRDEAAAVARAAEILTEAFAEDPAMQYFTAPTAPENRPALRRKVIELLIERHLRAGHSLWGWRAEGALIGCALVEDAAPSWRQFATQLAGLPALARLPLRVLARLNAYARRSQRQRPAGSGPFLAMIGLAETARGKGAGRAFMMALHRHYPPGAHWVLDTENCANLAFYERLGYQLHATETLGPVTLYKLHRLPEAGNHP